MCEWTDDLFTIPHMLLPIQVYHLLCGLPNFRGSIVLLLLLLWEGFELGLLSTGSWVIFPGDEPEGECGILQDLFAGFLGIIIASLMPSSRSLSSLLSFLISAGLYTILCGWGADSLEDLSFPLLYVVHLLNCISLQESFRLDFFWVGLVIITAAWFRPRGISTSLASLICIGVLLYRWVRFRNAC